jgi:cbb3-type cytochrome c oxidase subunit III
MRKPLSLIIVLIVAAIFLAASWGESVASVQTGKGKSGVTAVYKKHCANCHGEDGKGLETLQPPDFTDGKWQSENTDKAIADGIRNGKGVMPGFKDVLSPAQVNSMVRYVRAFRPKPTKSAKK